MDGLLIIADHLLPTISCRLARSRIRHGQFAGASTVPVWPGFAAPMPLGTASDRKWGSVGDYRGLTVWE